MKFNMQFKRPKNTEKYYWTRHSIGKMMQYGLSAQRVIRVIRAPKRIVEGVAKNTIAVMQPASLKKGSDGEKVWTQEIWVMYQIGKNKKNTEKKFSFSGDNIDISKMNLSKPQLKIISAWRYPGVSPEGKDLPEEILDEIAEAGFIV